MKALRVSFALLFVLLAQLTPSFASAQEGTPTFSNRYDGRLLGPNRGAGLFVTVTNTTDTPIVVSGVTMTDLITPEACPRHWFGDAGYPDRPRGENETTPPVPAYPLPSAWLEAPISLEPGEEYELPMMELFMIQAAPNPCQGINLSPVLDVAWEFVVTQTYGTVSGTITDVNSGLPLDTATVAITGTTDDGVVSEQVPVDGSGFYISTNNYHTDSELSVTASMDGYTSSSNSATVVEGPNTVNIALEQVPISIGTISGTVVDTNTGEPIPNAVVVLNGVDAADNPATDTVYTNASGQFISTTEFKAGTTVSMSVSADGYVSGTSSIEPLAEGTNSTSTSLMAVEVEEPPVTPTPDATQTETPSPEATETDTQEPDPIATETPVAETPTITPTVDDPESTAPVESEQPTPTAQVVSTLPSTGTGSVSSVGLMMSGALALSGMIAVGIRRHKR